jgi:hypothetical protein
MNVEYIHDRAFDSFKCVNFFSSTEWSTLVPFWPRSRFCFPQCEYQNVRSAHTSFLYSHSCCISPRHPRGRNCIYLNKWRLSHVDVVSQLGYTDKRQSCGSVGPEMSELRHSDSVLLQIAACFMLLFLLTYLACVHPWSPPVVTHRH